MSIGPRPLEAHPLAQIFPLMEGKEFDALVASIKANGLREKIWLYEGRILEGRNRYRACQAGDIEPQFREYTGNDPLGFVIDLKLHRRHLSETQRAMVAGRLATMPVGRPGEIPPIGGISAANASKRFGVGTRSIERARELAEQEPVQSGGCKTASVI